MVKLTIEGYFPSLNDFIDANRKARRNWNGGNAMKQRDQHTLNVEIRSQLRRQLRPPITIDYRYFCKDRKRDLDNISGYFHKIFQDALVQSGRLENDSWKFITGFSDTFDLDRSNPRIEITIHEKGDT